MKKIIRIFSRVTLASVILFVVAIAYSTVKGSTRLFRVNGSVTVDGHPTGGYLHTDTRRTVLVITRTDGSRPETYIVLLAANKAILDCGSWHPVRFLPNAVGELNPLCVNVNSEDVVDPPVGATLVRAQRSIQFTTASGKKVRAEF